jgi:ABC-2 type transport system ATP-binding protein
LKHLGKTIFLTTHYLDEAEAISDQIAIVSKGRLLKVGTVLELKSALKQTIRVDITSGFSEDELSSYGKVMRIGDTLRVLTDADRAGRLTSLAIERRTQANVSPVSLDDVFIDLVGADEDEGAES